ncbi:MAG: type II toxin-antitoxin system RatA family toxin [Parvibaculales bacterium]
MTATHLLRQSPYTSQQMYDLVKDVAAYPEFVPYCTGARVRDLRPYTDGLDVMSADLMIAYKMIRETYTSDVILDENQLVISVTQARGPFRKLKNEWRFHDKGAGCEIDFFLDFDFKAPLLRRVIQPLMGRAVEKFVEAFEGRAEEIYG